MAKDYTAVSSPDDEEERRLRDEMYPPVNPPAPPTASAPTATAGYPAVESSEPLDAMESGGSKLRGMTGNAEQAAQAPAPKPPSWKDYAPAERHGWGKFGSIMATLNPISNEIVNNRPLRNAERNYGAATKEFGEEQAVGKEQSEEQLRESAAERNRNIGDAAIHPPLKPKEEEWSVVPGMTGQNGEAVQQEKTSGKVRLVGPNDIPGGVEPLKQPATPEKSADIKDYLEAHNLPDTAANREKARGEIANRGKQEPGSYMPVNDAKGNTVGWIDPKSGHFRSSAGIPGLGEAAPGGIIPPKPTAQERNVSAQARVAAEGIPNVVSEIDKLKDQLGPVSGRWNEFMQGRVGMENPEMAGLRADLLMVSSAVALAHARGRLPENLREEFDRAINSPKQDPENLKAVLNHILPWMQRMENMSDQAPPAAGAGQGGGQPERPAHVPPNYVHKDNGPKGSGWYKP